jgi:hypothetical protein
MPLSVLEGDARGSITASLSPAPLRPVQCAKVVVLTDAPVPSGSGETDGSQLPRDKGRYHA